MLSMEDDGDYPSPPSTPSASNSFSCDEGGSDLERYCSANSVLERSSYCSSMGFDDTFSSFSRSNSNRPSPTFRPSNREAEDSISISGDDCTDREVQSDDDSPRSFHGMNGFHRGQNWNQNQNQNQNQSSGVERESERRSSILMDSSVAFGSDDWDEFMLERGDGSGQSAPVYLFQMESIHSKEQTKHSGAEPGCNKGEVTQEIVQSSDVKQNEPVYCANDPPSSRTSGGNSGSSARENKWVAVATENGSNGDNFCGSIKKTTAEGVEVSEHSESLNEKYEGKAIEDGHVIMTTGGTNTGFEMELKGIDQVNKNGGTNNFLDDMVLEMEEILLNSESHSPRSNTDNQYKNHATTLLVRHSRGESSSASTSGTDDSYRLGTNPQSIDSVELIGAKQKKGDVSFGERLVGVKEYTVYKFKVRSGSDFWQVERRYRDFYSLYRQLKALFTAHGLTLPLPWSHVETESKKVFGNSSPSVIADRSVLLQECLSSILTSSYPFGTPTPLLTFLSLGKTLTTSPVPSNSPSKNLIPSDFMGKKISLMVDVRAHKSVKQLLELQHHKCAGCHRSMDSESTFLRDLAQTVGWSRNFRFCEYTGQLFCTVCHVNDTAVIPGRVLHGWDFTLYPVSQLAKAYLESINDQPMLCVSAVNPFLFSKVPALLHVMGLRKKIAAVIPYIICPFRKSVENGLRSRRYLLECNDFFALRDLVDLSKGVFAGFPVMVERLHKKIEEHITQQCLVCYDAGVPCAARNSCHDPFSLIFPFQEPEAEKCSLCGSIYHASCFMALDGCSCKKSVISNTDKKVGPAHQSDGLVNRLTFSSSQSTSGFFSDIISKARSDKIWKPRNRSPIILMGSLPGGTSQ